MKSKKPIKTISYVFEAPRTQQYFPVVGDLFEGADMGRKRAIKPNLKFSAPTACARCGQLFAAVVRTGRPERFCSEPCRVAEAIAQRRDWQVTARAEPEDRPTNCQCCGAPLVVKSEKAGRFRRFCSTRCLKKSREPPRKPDLLDIACTDPENQPRQEPEGHEPEENNR